MKRTSWILGLSLPAVVVGLLSSPVVAVAEIAIRLLAKSGEQLLTPADVSGRSRTFLNYAAAEIEARHGRIFSDPDLDLFFRHAGGYEPTTTEASTLSAVESANLDTLKAAASRVTFEPMVWIWAHDLGGRPIFYLGSEVYDQRMDGRRGDFQYGRGEFVELPATASWMVECSSIPPEIVSGLAVTRIEMRDYGSVLRLDQIEVGNLNAGLIGDSGEEIRVRLDGPSDDPEVIYLGVDGRGTFRELARIPSGGHETVALNERFLRLDARVRTNYIGTDFHNRGFLFDSVEDRLIPLPILVDLDLSGFRGGRHLCRQGPVSIYADAPSAFRQDSAAVFDTLKSGASCRFVHLFALDELAAVQVRFPSGPSAATGSAVAPDSVTGWIDAPDVHKFDGIPYAD